MASGRAVSDSQTERTALITRALHVFSDEALYIAGTTMLGLQMPQYVGFGLLVDCNGEYLQILLVITTLCIGSRHERPFIHVGSILL